MQIDEAAAVQRVMNLIGVRGGSGQEADVCRRIQEELRQAGIPDSAMHVDSACDRSPIGGNTGNLIVRLKGTRRGARRLLMAHMDTVPLAVDSEPVQDGDWIRPRSPDTALGADDRAGCAVVLTAVLELVRQRLPHPPLTLLFTVQEEVGLIGARLLARRELGNPQLCFNWDGRDPADLITGAVGATYVDVHISGIASHAGVHPEDGVNAAVVASIAAARLHREGWHGRIIQGRSRGTANIGIMQGGAATNVVMPEMTVRAEARSHSRAFRSRIVRAYRRAFQEAAREVKNADGQTASVTVTEDTRYEPFRIPQSAAVVKAAVEAVRSCGMRPRTSACDGGLDANWMTAHGFPAVTLGCGQYHIHTVDEQLHIPDFLAACRIACTLAQG